MGNEIKSKFTKKVSPLIEGQVPDFVQADHPVFVDFVKDYFKFLEAGKLSISGDIDYIVQETRTTAFILEETDGDRIVTEAASGSGAKFKWHYPTDEYKLLNKLNEACNIWFESSSPDSKSTLIGVLRPSPRNLN